MQAVQAIAALNAMHKSWMHKIPIEPEGASLPAQTGLAGAFPAVTTFALFPQPQPLPPAALLEHNHPEDELVYSSKVT